MLVVPLTNSPNQTFSIVLPVDGENRSFKFELWYNEIAEYWLISATDTKTNTKLFDNLPLLTSYGEYFNILNQLSYKKIGTAGVLPQIGEFQKSMPDDTNLGKEYVLIWGDT